jgi:hypothetical protein
MTTLERRILKCRRPGCTNRLPALSELKRYKPPGYAKPGWFIVRFLSERRASKRVCSRSCGEYFLRKAGGELVSLG